jgi:hypothetical protein
MAEQHSWELFGHIMVDNKEKKNGVARPAG